MAIGLLKQSSSKSLPILRRNSRWIVSFLAAIIWIPSLHSRDEILHLDTSDRDANSGLPRFASVTIGENTILDFVLVPNGKVRLGTATPIPVAKVSSFPATSFLLACIGAALFLAGLVRSRRQKISLQVALLLSLGISFIMWGSFSYCGWNEKLRLNVKEQLDYDYDAVRYRECGPDELHDIEVALSMPFYISTKEISRLQYYSAFGASDTLGDEYAITELTFDDCLAYCKILSEKFGVQFRLPKEAEWEWACSQGASTRFSNGDSETELDVIAWYSRNSGGSVRMVGRRSPNSIGLYDMHGNVWEWVAPHGASPSTDAIIKGGSFKSGMLACRTACRVMLNGKATKRDDIGFRIVLEVTAESLSGMKSSR